MLSGSIVALVTPMKKNGSVDYEALENLMNFHIKNNTNAIVVAGTTGESATLTHNEHQKVISFLVEKAKSNIFIIAGTGSNSTSEAVELTQYARQAGANACLLLSPYYNRPTQEGLYLHYKAIANAVPIPQILYNVPSRTASDILPETVIKLSQIPNIIGIKEASGCAKRVEEITASSANDFCVYSGDDALGLEMMKLGAQGCISVTANIFPKATSSMYNGALNKNWEHAQKIHKILFKMNEILFCESNPIPIKYLLSTTNIIENTLRLPLTTLSSNRENELTVIYEEAFSCLEKLSLV